MIHIATSTGDTRDYELWQRIRMGDEMAFTAIFEKYHRTLYNYGSKLSTNSSLVEDAIQDVFIDIWRLRANLTQNVISVKFYLYRALRRRIHVALDKFPSMEEISELDDEEMPANHTHSEAVLIEMESSSMRAQRIHELLNQLPERQLEALTLRYFDDFSIEEIAEIMGVNEKSVRNFIYKAITSLRQSREILLVSSLILWLLLFF
ncbi:RNA polymerase sigma factor [Dyadobacter sp. CY261]|uniref:RNA polymerase sigma factor n=1 Tax=Dyadobacter sp. CY261 TaxID=2907203 RepID=UPI001F3D2331|nr:RNA polymerase sigma factor [Dyadobacter sp. CY261]MCF0074589.1 RNA polymerase sigma factor [Dyadobacter sp. CY261]